MSRLLQVQPFLNAFSLETLSAKPMDTKVFPFNAARFVRSTQYSLGAAFLRPVNTVSAFSHDTIDAYQPQTEEQSELLIVGRSNVGKSSLINALTAQEIATTSKTPGKTQQLIFHQVAYRDGAVYLVDAPGYGYANAPAEEMNKWAKLMQTYLKKSVGYCCDRLKRILALVDAQVGVKKADETLFAYLCELRKPYIVVLTKADKLRAEQLRKVQKEVATLVSTHWAASPLLFSTSAKAQYGLMELRAYLAYLLEEERPKRK